MSTSQGVNVSNPNTINGRTAIDRFLCELYSSSAGTPVVSFSSRHILRLLAPKNDNSTESQSTCSSRVAEKGGSDIES